MSKALNLKGQRFGRLLVLEKTESKKISPRHTVTMWICRCDCGNEKIIRSDSLRSGRTQSCGCFREERISNNERRHGMSKDRLYVTWTNMKKRCHNPKIAEYENYGGRGISVCEEWKTSFKAFYEWSMLTGYEENLTIDRINVNGNYEPSNCRWIPRKEQSLNKTTSHYLTYDGKTQTIKEWADELGFKYDTLHSRIMYYKWSVEKALTTPVKQ